MNKRRIAVSITLLTILGLAVPSISIFLPKPSPLDKSIVKQFVYDISPTYPPVVGLDVDLYNEALTPVASGVTDASGYVTFVGLTDQTYTIKWMWGGAEQTESKLIDCTQIVWDLGRNELESKSGGGLRLAEAREQSLSRQPSSDSQNG